MITAIFSTHLFASMVVSCQDASPQMNFDLYCDLIYHLVKTNEKIVFFPLYTHESLQGVAASFFTSVCYIML